jgi:tryptophan-rich sensory protein
MNMGQEKQKQEHEVVSFAADEQTGKVFELVPEGSADIKAATISVIYLILMLLFFTWQFVDISTGRMLLLKKILQENADKLSSEMCRIIAYAVIGGGLGGVVNGFRSILTWHAERQAFGWRFLWKYITLPLLGATLAAIVYALTRAGIAVVGGNVAGGNSSSGADFTVQAFSAFAIGALSGYGSQKVFKWLDEHVNRLFKISAVADVTVPNLRGKTRDEVIMALRKLELNLGKVEEQVSEEPAEFNKVIRQSPPADTKVLKASSVGIIVAKESVSEAKVPNLKDKTEQEAKNALEKLGLKAKVETQDTSDTKEVGKVISQSPSANTTVEMESEVTITVGKKV